MTNEELVQIAERTAWRLVKPGERLDEKPDRLPHRVKDVRQNVFLALTAARPQIEAARNPRAYAYRTAWRAAVQCVTERQPETPGLSGLPDPIDRFWCSVRRQRHHVDVILDRDEISWLLAQVSPEAALGLRLKYEDGYSWTEVSTQLGKTEAAVKKLCARAIFEIRKKSCPDSGPETLYMCRRRDNGRKNSDANEC